MKSVLILSLILTQTALASSRQANRDEIKLLCSAVSDYMEIQENHVEVDIEKCWKISATAKTNPTGTISVNGVIPTSWAGIPGSDKCRIIYRNTPVTDNIVNGIERGVSCK